MEHTVYPRIYSDKKIHLLEKKSWTDMPLKNRTSSVETLAVMYKNICKSIKIKKSLELLKKSLLSYIVATIYDNKQQYCCNCCLLSFIVVLEGLVKGEN